MERRNFIKGLAAIITGNEVLKMGPDEGEVEDRLPKKKPKKVVIDTEVGQGSCYATMMPILYSPMRETHIEGEE
jgi:hypothetical protein